MAAENKTMQAMESPAACEGTAEIVKRIAAEIEPQVIAWRRMFHRHPELSGVELFTSAAIRAELDKLGVEFKVLPTPDEVKGAGIVATIRGTPPDAYDAAGNPKRRIALRADFDGLPIAERAKLAKNWPAQD